MGVPAFFRWLSRKYPSIIVNCVEEKPKECNGVKIPVDASKPNPNDVEFDNLYLDMNGIIHPCTHPEDKPAPKNEDEMMVAIFEYIDRLFNIVRPRRLLYMAIDGVAPRAKMNQQRSRRFRASKEGMEAAVEKQRVREEILAKGGFLPPEEIKERFDSNCITPGTEFMDNLAKCLRYYIADRLNNDPGWKNLTVILSDASAPGEGEHKIMDYIRRQRAQPNHDPNTHHCLCGADADLIMLGLATHEPNFTIIREEFKPNKPKPCALCNQFGHEVKDCEGLPREKKGKDSFRRRQKEKRKRMKRDQPAFTPSGILTPHALGSRNSPGCQVASNPRQAAYEMRMQSNSSPSISPNTSFASDGSPSPLGGIKRKAEDSDSEPEPEDNVRLWEAGWKQRYYKNKFDVDAADEKFRRKVVQSYVEGLCWVLRYYYQGCASWKWYYPFHYAPFASDFDGIADMSSEFEKGTKPFKPLEQLMGVFPAASGNFLPPTWRKLMSDPDSSIIDFYPEDFAIDLNGKKYAWQGVALLPFVDERRLRAALEEVYPDLTPEENRRNSLGGDVLFVGKLHPLHDFILELYQTGSTEPIDVPPELCHGIQGKFSLDEEAILPDQTVCSPVPMLRDLTQNTAVSINFKDPQFAEDYVFKAVMLPGARKPAAVLKPGDWEKSSNGRQWKPQLGFNRDRRPVHLDQAAFRTLGHVMPRGSGTGVYSNTAPPPANYQGNVYRPLLRGQAQIPKLMSNMRPQDSWRGPPPLFQQQRFDRSVGAEPLLPWNRMLQTQNAAFQPNQYQMLAGPGGYPPRRDDRGGRQGYPREGRKYPLPPPSGRYSWN
ncbi:5'-3' exoribonuclease 2 isoform X3 [Meriones unguiculatus]|uniref:5'-3' exoribonuclease 2 isoform X3 n=1 Tax=Meriones unguiculatus TaxID=10047 RepID=UPI000B4F5C14|nr:5'-3' exoribonuclease 2 isoform X3 [Meriones unguiculatus]